MKVLFCGLKNEYGKPSAGPSFEYQNFYDVLCRMEGVEARFFGMDEVMAQAGRDKMNEMLTQEVIEWQPDLLFCFLFTEELKKETIKYITDKTSTKTFNWFADDHWRFEIFSKYWAPLFTAIGTTDSQAVEKYKELGIKNVIHTQWGVNTKLFFPKPSSENYEITFVGINYSKRQEYIKYLQDSGLPVQAFGTGWLAGRIPKEKTAEIWSNSKINLNFTESYAYGSKFLLKSFVRLFVKKELGRYKFDVHHFFANFKSALSMRSRQIKSRTFEIPACGGFLITGDADNLGDYFINGKEIVIFKDKKELAEKCKFYLAHPEERKKITEAGYQKVLTDHTYEQRFKQIFKTMGLL